MSFKSDVIFIELFFQQGFLEMDEKMKTESSLKDDMSGSTAITALMKNEKVKNCYFPRKKTSKGTQKFTIGLPVTDKLKKTICFRWNFFLLILEIFNADHESICQNNDPFL